MRAVEMLKRQSRGVESWRDGAPGRRRKPASRADRRPALAAAVALLCAAAAPRLARAEAPSASPQSADAAQERSEASAAEASASTSPPPLVEVDARPRPDAVVPLKEERAFAWKEEWGRAKPLEYVSTFTFGIGALATQAIEVTDRGWGGNGFDNTMRSGLRLRDRDARQTARSVSDFLYYGLMAYPLVVDTFLVAGSKNSDVAWQMFVIDLHSLAVSGFAALTIERTAGRSRPFLQQCANNPSDAEDCDSSSSEKYQSFLSGHTMLAFTGAGLTCAHHLRLPLYGGGIADVAACGVAVAGATAQGLLRVASDRHYFTDVLAGSSLGFAAGYALPMLLHYGRGSRDTKNPVQMVAPYTNGREVGLQAAGAF